MAIVCSSAALASLLSRTAACISWQLYISWQVYNRIRCAEDPTSNHGEHMYYSVSDEGGLLLEQASA